MYRHRNCDGPVKHVFPYLTRRIRPTSSIRGVLIAGFAVVFGLWVLSGYELVRRLAALEQRTAAEHSAALHGARLLTTIRTNVLLGSIFLRDAIIDNRSMNVDYYRDELNKIRGEVERLMPAYVVDVTSSEERQHWTQLQKELNEFWKSRELAFSPDAPLNTTEAAAVLRRRVVPSRTAILQILDRLSELQVLSQQRHETEVSALYGELRNRFLLFGSLAILVGLIVAVLATNHVGRLERQIERQRSDEERTRRDLERLSARLVTVQEEERRSLSRELHDEVGQALTAIKMDVTVARRGLDGLQATESGARIVSWLEDARSIAENTLQSVRDLSQLLHPSMLDDFGLPEALRSYVRTFSKRTGISAQFVQHGREQRLPQAMEVCLYRIAQEALTNVVRHSGARAAVVTLSQTDHGLAMTIDDDGHGIDQQMSRFDASSTRGLGVIGMRERVQALGGTFALESRRGGGTRVAVQLPAVPPPADLSERSDPELLAG
jgi:signal transduction histidine kinase